jgi:uncharacterized protein YecE (DUF72 family)
MDLRFGVAGWDYPDWRGIVYPAKRPRGFDPLELASLYVPVIEINRTYYRPASVNEARGWLERLRDRPRFTFTAKLPERFVRPGASWSDDDVREARAGLDLLHENGRLAGAVLQFAWSFHRARKDGSLDQSARAWLHDVLTAFEGLPLFVEFRHESWNTQAVVESLRERNVGWVNVDQPQLFKGSMPLTAIATSPVAYLRMHGRNYQSWGKGLGRRRRKVGEPPPKPTTEERKASEAQKNARFDYLYSERELRGLAAEVERLEGAPGVEAVITIHNNHARGQAFANALTLRSLLEGGPVPAPPELVQAYPSDLAAHATPVSAEHLRSFAGPAQEEGGVAP